MTPPLSPPRVAVIGAGFSALSLLSLWRERGAAIAGVIVYADAREACTGLAYADSAGQSLLNTRAADLGLSPSQVGAFADWLGLSGPDRDGFRTRVEYGAYLRAQWADLLQASPFPIEVVARRAESVQRTGAGFIVGAGERRDGVDQVVLANGPLPALPLPMLDDATRRSPHYVDDPWRNAWSDGLAADASVVMLEMKRSLDVMTESMNVTTQFVSDTQIFFRSNLDTLVKDLDTFDETTTALLDENLKKSKEVEDARIAAAVAKATQRAQAAGPAAAGPAA